MPPGDTELLVPTFDLLPNKFDGPVAALLLAICWSIATELLLAWVVLALAYASALTRLGAEVGVIDIVRAVIVTVDVAIVCPVVVVIYAVCTICPGLCCPGPNNCIFVGTLAYVPAVVKPLEYSRYPRMRNDLLESEVPFGV